MRDSRHYTFWDRICLNIDQVVRTLSNNAKNTNKANPGEKISALPLTAPERRQSAGLMRVNHAGEVCAQALYHGQSIASQSNEVQNKMHQAALEEGDHLNWCQQRLDELGSHTSYLNIIWYTGSFCIGLVAGLVGDKWSLGFVAETEQQVIKHLKSHLYLLPQKDERSQAILRQMEEDETKHRDEAIASGAHELPLVIQAMMSLTSKVMVKTAYYL